MKEKDQHPYSSKTEIEKKKQKNLTIDLDGHIIQEQTLLFAYKQNMHKSGKLAKKYLFLVFLLIQTTVFAQKVNNRISNKKQIENIVQWYAVEDWNRNGIREFVIEKCSKTLKENGLKEVEIVKKISSRLIVNKASFKLKNKIINNILDNFSKVVDH